MILWKVKEFEMVGSTQNEANRMAVEGAAEGTVIVARKQTAGKGRFNRKWASPEGGLYMSVVFRPAAEEAFLLTFAGALAVFDGIATQTRLSPSIRWPNDVLLTGKKVGGVIGDANFSGSSLSFVVVGMGINCNFPASSLGELSKSSTTLKDLLMKEVDIVSLRKRTLQSFGRLYELIKEQEGHRIVRRVRTVLSTVGKRVTYETVGGRRRFGTAQELLDDGSLRVFEEGRTYDLRPEETRWLKED